MLGSPQDAEDLVQETMLRWACSVLSEIAAVRRVGRAAAGVDRIVAEAQVVKATFYRHFPAKGDLVCAELAELSQRQLAALRRLPADAELPHALVEIVGGPPYRGSPFINAAAEYARP
jgi:AcrR family transcriptional regulator